ncbi:MAG: methionine adenosyltransferase [Pseudorhodoplanes sp.]|nr:methionine adenosyltransferase [Pseudorhodoplanes sp.]
MSSEMIFTSESVTMGHPDKLCDQISDAAIDAFLSQDAGARAVVECAAATGVVFLAARFAALASVDLPGLARKVIADAGYLGDGFDARSCSILTSFSELPLQMREPPLFEPDNAAFDLFPSHDQANVFGYACRETPELMPLPVSLAHRLAHAVDSARRGGLSWLSPDAKTQVSVVYRDFQPFRIHGIALTAAIDPDASPKDAEQQLRAVVLGALAEGELEPDESTRLYINAADHSELGGPARHAGLTGRKNGIDTYGEIARQSGAALSGKDPSRVDRTGAYAARHAAKTIVAAKLAHRCEVHLAYAIGQSHPLSLSVETFGTGRMDDDALAKRLAAILDMRPAAITHRFGLRTQPGASVGGFYRPLAVYGHFGRPELDLPWEKTDLAAALLS